MLLRLVQLRPADQHFPDLPRGALEVRRCRRPQAPNPNIGLEELGGILNPASERRTESPCYALTATASVCGKDESTCSASASTLFRRCASLRSRNFCCESTIALEIDCRGS